MIPTDSLLYDEVMQEILEEDYQGIDTTLFDEGETYQLLERVNRRVFEKDAGFASSKLLDGRIKYSERDRA